MELNWPGLYTDLGTVDLAAGPHRVTITVDKGGWHPGSGGDAVLVRPAHAEPAGHAAQRGGLGAAEPGALALRPPAGLGRSRPLILAG